MGHQACLPSSRCPSTSIWLRATADIHPGAGKLASFQYSTTGANFQNIGNPYTLNNTWEFFLGYRYGIFNYATQSLGGSVLVKSFTMDDGTDLPSTGGSSSTTTLVTTTPAPTSSKTTTSVKATTSAAGGSGGTVAQWSQCGGIGYTGPTVCASPYTCHYSNDYYSQCY